MSGAHARAGGWCPLLGAGALLALTALAATAATESFDSFGNGTELTTIGGGGVWAPSTGYTVIDGGGVAGSKGLSNAGPIFNWQAQPFKWSALAVGAKVAMSLDFQSSTTAKFNDDRVGWTVDATSATSNANQLALQLDNVEEGGMVVYWNGTRTVLNALSGIKVSTWYRFKVEFTKLTATSAGIVGTLSELDGSGNPIGTPYIGTIANTSTFANPPDTARFTSTSQWPSFKNYNAADGNADNPSFVMTLPLPTPSFSAVTPSQSILAGTASVTLGGKLSAAGPIYPAAGEIVKVTINGVTQNAPIGGAAGAFSLAFPTAAIPLRASPYPITYTYAGNGTTLNAATNHTSTTLTVTDPYVAWINTKYPTLTGSNALPGADPDGDGLTNRGEYAFGLNPTLGTSVNPIASGLSAGHFGYTRRDPALTGLTYSVWTSPDLVTWTRDVGALEGAITAVGDVQTVPVTLTAAPSNSKLFVRVQAD